MEKHSRIYPLREIVKKSIFFLFYFFLFLLFFTKEATAVIDCPLSWETNPPGGSAPINSIILQFNGREIPTELKNYPPGGALEFSFPGTLCGTPNICNEVEVDGTSKNVICVNPPGETMTKPELVVTPSNCNAVLQPTESGNEHQVEIIYEWITGSIKPPYTKKAKICKLKTFPIYKEKPTCKVDHYYTGDGTIADPSHTIVISEINEEFSKNYLYLEITVDGDVIGVQPMTSSSGRIEQPIPASHRTALAPNGFPWHEAIIYGRKDFPVGGRYGRGPICGKKKFNIAPLGATPLPTIPATTPGAGDVINPSEALDICKPLLNHPDPKEHDRCVSCISKSWAYTALGCIPTDPTGFVQRVFAITIPIMAGILFLGLIYTGFLAITSTGEPEKVQHTKDVAKSLIFGALLILFSVFIYGLIGGTILGIPGIEVPTMTDQQCTEKGSGLASCRPSCGGGEYVIGECKGNRVCCSR